MTRLDPAAELDRIVALGQARGRELVAEQPLTAAEQAELRALILPHLHGQIRRAS